MAKAREQGQRELAALEKAVKVAQQHAPVARLPEADASTFATEQEQGMDQDTQGMPWTPHNVSLPAYPPAFTPQLPYFAESGEQRASWDRVRSRHLGHGGRLSH